MKILATRDVMDLQMMVEGYRSMAETFEKALSEANWRLRTANSLIAKQDEKIQAQHEIIRGLEAELIERDINEGHETVFVLPHDFRRANGAA